MSDANPSKSSKMWNKTIHKEMTGKKTDSAQEYAWMHGKLTHAGIIIRNINSFLTSAEYNKSG